MNKLSTLIQNSTATVIDIVSLDQIAMEPIDWLIKNWLPLGKLVLLAGQAGTGKTQLAISIAAKLSAGLTLVDGSQHPPSNVLIWTGEDDASTVIVPRFKAAMADMSRVHIIQGVTEPNGKRRPFDFAIDLPELKHQIAEIGEVVLIIIDPIVSVVAGDSNKSSDVRAGLQPIVELAQELNCAIIGITHYRKGIGSQNVSDDVLGSQAYIAVPRVAWGTKRRDSDQACVIAIIKNNLAPVIGGYEYAIEPCVVYNDQGQAIETSRINWGEYREQSAVRIFREYGSDLEEDTDNLSEPIRILIELLKDGSARKVGDIRQLVEQRSSVSWRSVQRAASKLNLIRLRSNAFQGDSTWQLPANSKYINPSGSVPETLVSPVATVV